MQVAFKQIFKGHFNWTVSPKKVAMTKKTSVILSNQLPTAVMPFTDCGLILSRLNRKRFICIIRYYQWSQIAVCDSGIGTTLYVNCGIRTTYGWMRICCGKTQKMFMIVGIDDGRRDGRIKLAESELLCLKWWKLWKAASMVQYTGVCSGSKQKL